MVATQKLITYTFLRNMSKSRKFGKWAQFKKKCYFNLNFSVFRPLKHKSPFSPTTGNYILGCQIKSSPFRIVFLIHTAPNVQPERYPLDFTFLTCNIRVPLIISLFKPSWIHKYIENNSIIKGVTGRLEGLLCFETIRNTGYNGVLITLRVKINVDEWKDIINIPKRMTETCIT
ncbi:hypothetical protein AGLY_000976 [Aphis glycines]|uniref:Uncharacterized protein n=1 Tax=Aphis glycines TaxID=307491 RepID=A0A6G0U908_APHGL|nr:hypothetical protein AGLY_000976 [Aphis glycines]